MCSIPYGRSGTCSKRKTVRAVAVVSEAGTKGTLRADSWSLLILEKLMLCYAKQPSDLHLNVSELESMLVKLFFP